MNLPESLTNAQTFTVVGPMGTKIPETFEAFPVMAVDGGARNTSRIDIWVGDSDSTSGPVSCVLKKNLNPDKDISDLASAFNLLLPTKVTLLHLWGFLGGRRDHELFNLGECLSFLGHKTSCSIFIYRVDGTLAFKLFSCGQNYFEHHGLFSVGTIETNEMSLNGDCMYSIPSGTVVRPLSSYGLSNIAKGIVKVSSTKPCFISFPENE